MSKRVIARTTLDELGADGSVKRTASVFRKWIKKDSPYPPEAGRYHLYVSYACPWASRCLAVRSVKGLEKVISVSVVHPTWQRTRPNDADDEHCGWVFRDASEGPIPNSLGYTSVPSDGATKDHILGKRSIREVYEHSKDTNGKYSVPVLFDKKTGTIVNNESADIVQMFATAFEDFKEGEATDVDLFPAGKEAAMKEVDDRLYDTLNNGVYRAGFAQSQQAFDLAVKDIFETLEWLEKKLDKSRYLLGDKISSSDIRAYVTLVRFDPVYVVHFKCSTKMIREFPNVYAYVRDLYQHPKIKPTTNIDHIVRHYYTSHVTLNKFGIIPPCGTDLDLPHDRATRKYSA